MGSREYVLFPAVGASLAARFQLLAQGIFTTEGTELTETILSLPAVK